MALENLISVAFSDDDLLRLDSALSEIEHVFQGKAVNLTPHQRQQYGRVAYEMEVWVDKASGYMQQAPQLVPQFIDRAEHAADLTAHRALNPRIDRMNMLLHQMQDTNLLLGSDLYNNSLSFYRSLREAAKSNAPGASTLYAGLKQQFPGGGKKKPEDGTS